MDAKFSRDCDNRGDIRLRGHRRSRGRNSETFVFYFRYSVSCITFHWLRKTSLNCDLNVSRTMRWAGARISSRLPHNPPAHTKDFLHQRSFPVKIKQVKLTRRVQSYQFRSFGNSRRRGPIFLLFFPQNASVSAGHSIDRQLSFPGQATRRSRFWHISECNPVRLWHPIG